MSKNLETLFNVEEIKKAKSALNKINEISEEDEMEEDTEYPEEVKECIELEKQLQTLYGSDEDDCDLDKYANEAFESYKHMMEIGDNFSDTRFAGDMYKAAVSMLKNAIDAKNSKTMIKLKKMEVILKAEKMLQTNKVEDKEEMEKGNIISSRSDILKAIKDQR